MRKFNNTQIKCNEGFEGLSIEREIEKLIEDKTAIEATSPIIYTERKDGVRPEFDIRTDRFDIALEAMSKVTGSYRAKREESIKAREEAKNITLEKTVSEKSEP